MAAARCDDKQQACRASGARWPEDCMEASYQISTMAEARPMTSETETKAAARRYPALAPAQTTTLNAKLVEVVMLRHPDLTAQQRADLAAAMEQQTRHLEALHRFPLTNADEPAFIRSPLGAAG
jgi:Spy/CpxP family protein refolding chaperone